MKHEDYMKEALKEAYLAVEGVNEAFGVVVVNTHNYAIIWRDHDRVKELFDPTAIGEINAIRALCKNLQTLSLINMTFYTTSEPCTTCVSAIVKAKSTFKFYGAETESTAS